MRVCFIFCFLLLSSNAFSGYINYFNAVNEGEYHMYQGNYELAIANFNHAFDIVGQPFARDYYLAAKCYSQLNQPSEMYHFLEKAVTGGLDQDFIISDSLWFTDFRFEPKFKSLEAPVNNKQTEPVNYDSLYYQVLKRALNDTDSMQRQWIKTIVKDRGDTTAIANARANHKAFVINNHDSIVELIISKGISNFSELQNVQLQLLDTYVNIYEFDDQKAVDYLFTQLDDGIITPVQFAIIAGRGSIDDHPDYFYGIHANSILPDQLDLVIKNRKQIGLSIYYARSPNYTDNIAPFPVSEHFKISRESKSSN